MAIEYGFFNSVNDDRLYDADDISNYFLQIITDGVFESQCEVTAGAGMKVETGTGWAFIQGKWAHITEAETLTIDAADTTNPRIDRIVLRLNEGLANRDITLMVKKGTAAASPEPPALQRVAGAVWELSLAQVAVPAGASSVTVTDERDTEFCGYVKSKIGDSGNLPYVICTQAEYDAITSPDEGTLYVIREVTSS